MTAAIFYITEEVDLKCRSGIRVKMVCNRRRNTQTAKKKKKATYIRPKDKCKNKSNLPPLDTKRQQEKRKENNTAEQNF